MNTLRSGFTLIEVVIVAALTALVFAFVASMLLGTQDAVTDSTANQAVTDRSRSVAEQLAVELRDLNFTSEDFPDLPDGQLASVGPGSVPLRYRKVVGVNSGNRKVILDPTQGSGDFRQVVLSGGRVILENPAGTERFAIGSQIADLSFEEIPPNLLKIRVKATMRDHEGGAVHGWAEVTIQMQNEVSSSDIDS